MSPFVRFNIVGIAGFVVQLGALVALDALGVPLVLATGLAVEAAVVHNFFWHERWTWRGLPPERRAGRFLRFHAANGSISIAGNAAITVALAAAGMPIAAAVLTAALTCALLNFTAAQAWVFRKRGYGASQRGHHAALRLPEDVCFARARARHPANANG